MTTLQKPDIVETLNNEGISLKQRGRYYWASCPLHNERTPSFKVDPERQSFYCFGCHSHGDVIDFIQQYRNIPFKDSLSYLGINNTRKIVVNPKEARKRVLIAEYRRWQNDYTDFLSNVLKMLDRKKRNAKTMEQAEAISYHYHQEQIWEAHFEIMFGKDEKEKFALYRELNHGRRL